jgi:hypothetical protein
MPYILIFQPFQKTSGLLLTNHQAVHPPLSVLILVSCHCDEGEHFLSASTEKIFTASVTGYPMLLRNSDYKGSVTYDQFLEWHQESLILIHMALMMNSGH